jgi:hypothetical protein
MPWKKISNYVKLPGQLIHSNIGNLALWARSEVIGSAICPIYSWFQVSVKTNPEFRTLIGLGQTVNTGERKSIS